MKKIISTGKNVTEEALEEGRMALIELEKQLRLRDDPKEIIQLALVESKLENTPQILKYNSSPVSKLVGNENNSTHTNNEVSTNNSSNNTTGRNQQVISSRKMMDQIPRGTRLTQRLESLGLTVEELDDRGLIEGGAGSLPGSQYSSVRSRSRRSLELQSRSHRLQERGKEALSKVRNGLCHMLKVLARRGVDFERYCKKFCVSTSLNLDRSRSKNAPMTKKQFFVMLKSIGLPLSVRELHDITQYYTITVGSSLSLSDGPDTTASATNSGNVYDFGNKGSSGASNPEYADYLSLLRDARLLPQVPHGQRGSFPEEDEDMDLDIDFDLDGDFDNDVDEVHSYTQVLSNLKSMLMESTKSLGKHQDDVYRMFARWDTQGMGTVTATQFLRVLARLHVELSDQDQDFLVELLDTNAMGRIEFESLLNFCFTGSLNTGFDSPEYPLISPTSIGKQGGRLASGEDFTGETVSAVSIGTKETNGNFISGGSGSDRGKKSRLNDWQRPHTASSVLSRPYAEQRVQYMEPSNFGPGMQLQTHSLFLPTSSSELDPISSQTQQLGPPKAPFRRMNSDGDSLRISAKERMEVPTNSSGSNYIFGKGQQRPQTASGRVSSSSSRSEHSNQPDHASKDAKKYTSAVYNHLDSIYDDTEVYEDALLDENLVLSNTYSSERKSDNLSQEKDRPENLTPGYFVKSNQSGEQSFTRKQSEAGIFDRIQNDVPDISRGSIKDFWPPVAPLHSGAADNVLCERSDFRKGLDYGPERDWKEQNVPYPVGNDRIVSSDMMNATIGFADKESDDDFLAQEDEPIDHLVLLANQILTTLRDIVMTRYRRGKSLSEIYQQFDVQNKHYFDANDFVRATSELRLETSSRVAAIAVNLMAIDGYDKVCYGEFKVFVLDTDHKLLELNIQEQLAQQLEQHGRDYQSWMVDVFWTDDDSLNDSARLSSKSERDRQSGSVQKHVFISALRKIGAVLTASELNRLVDRFDMHGADMCSVTRFIRMIQTSEAWHHAEKILSYQEEAAEEAEYLRQQLRLRRSLQSNGGNGGGNRSEDGSSPYPAELADLPELSEELISICEYLGIRVLSEQNMLWIAADALKAPLPVSWTAQKDANGRTFFYNHLTNQSKWEHPLDPHFRKLRDKYRQSNAGLESTLGRNSQILGREPSAGSSVNSGIIGPNTGGSATPPIASGIAMNSAAAVGIAQQPSLSRPTSEVIRPTQPTNSTPNTETIRRSPPDLSDAPPSKLPLEDANRKSISALRPKSALQEKTNFKNGNNPVEKLTETKTPDIFSGNQSTPQQLPPRKQNVQFSSILSSSARPGSAPASSPTLIKSNGVTYSMNINNELKPYKPLAPDNPYIASAEIRSKVLVEPVYSAPYFKPARPASSQSKREQRASVQEPQVVVATKLPPATIASINAYFAEKDATMNNDVLKAYVTNFSDRSARLSSGGPKSRPSSAKRSAPSAVDRAISVGRLSSSHHSQAFTAAGGEAKKQHMLTKLLTNDVVGQLDNILAKSNTAPALLAAVQPQDRSHRNPASDPQRPVAKLARDRKGGIVVL